MYSARKFNKNSYDKYDNFAKEILMKYLKKIGYEILSSVENYEHDIVAKYNDNIYYFEVETKIKYPFKTKNTYAFDTVSFLGRKKRLHEIHKFKYIIICFETLWGIGCESDIIYNDDYIEKLYIEKRNGNDELYRVPIEKCSFFNLNIK